MAELEVPFRREVMAQPAHGAAMLGLSTMDLPRPRRLHAQHGRVSARALGPGHRAQGLLTLHNLKGDAG